MKAATSFASVCVLTVTLALVAFGQSAGGGATSYCRSGINKSIPDNDPAGITDTLTISSVPPGNVVLTIAFRIDSLIHTWVGDFRMTLTHAGITRTLMNQPGSGGNGSSGNNFIGTVLVDSATLRIDNITATGTPPLGPPYTGYFRPDSGGAPSIVSSSLSPFIGTDPNGEWIFFLSDNAGLDTGSIKSWCLLLETGPATSVDPIGTPGIFRLEQNYPNPFNPTTSIQFTLPVAASVTLKILNVMGQEIATLVNGHQEAGTFNATWNGRSNAGYSVASGLYFYELIAEGSSSPDAFRSMKKMVLMK